MLFWVLKLEFYLFFDTITKKIRETPFSCSTWCHIKNKYTQKYRCKNHTFCSTSSSSFKKSFAFQYRLNYYYLSNTHTHSHKHTIIMHLSLFWLYFYFFKTWYPYTCVCACLFLRFLLPFLIDIIITEKWP